MYSLSGPDEASPPALDAGVLTRCRHRVWLDAQAPGGARPPVDTGVLQRRDAAEFHRHAVRDRLWAQMPADHWLTVTNEGPSSERVRQTMTACADGIARIWGAMLPVDRASGRRGGVDLLIRDEHDGGYIPVLVVNHKVTDPGRGACTSPLTEWSPTDDASRRVRSQLRDQLRLAHLTRMLQALDLASPGKQGGVIGYDADCILVHDIGVVLDEYDKRFADRIAVARGESPTAASRVGECRTCPWWSQCRDDLNERRDVSLVVTGAGTDALRAAGVHTVDALAGYWDAHRPEPEHWSGPDFADAVTNAKAWLAGVPLVRRREHIGVTRADIEVDVDMESYQEDGAYLWGTLLTSHGEVSYRPFATWEPLPTEDEGRAFGEFWIWLMAVRQAAEAAGETFAAYCYSKSAENRWLLASARRFAGIAGVPTESEVRMFISGAQWVDIYQAISEQFVCPLGKGLKKIAPIAGFTWRDANAGGEASMGWYREAVGGADGNPDPLQRQRLLEYNEDDVWATKVLREWMSTRAESEIPMACDL